jgi:serine/threonine-protein kinase
MQLGRYEITGTLGRGAMGVVYQASDPLIERIVAIKTVACAGLPEKEAEEFELRFFREAKSAGRLNHPNIVTIHDVGRSDELAYIAMEFLSGQSLRTILDTGAPLSNERIIEIVAAVADGLAFAHAQDIVHRDIKPANIMVLDNGVVKITDFGIAQLPGGSLTMAGAVLGSPKYMSPEQVAGQKADGRADIFSLGTVLYEMLTGQPPFSGDNMHATMYQVVHKEPPPPSSCCAGLPKDFDPIVAKAMAKDPADRYQSASEMAADLRKVQFLAGSPLPGKISGQAAETAEGTVPAQSRQNSGRLRPVTIAATLILLTGAISTYFLLRQPVPANPSPPKSFEKSDAASAADESTPTTPATAQKPAAAAKETKVDRSSSSTAKAESTRSWKDALRTDLIACNEKSVFSKIMCIEKARWKHCPGHWGTIDDCPSSTGENKP